MKSRVLQFDEFIKASHTRQLVKRITELYKNTGTVMQIQASTPSNVSDIIMSLVGLETLAYIRPVTEGGFGVFAADGTQLAVFDSQENAYYTARRNNLQPVSIH